MQFERKIRKWGDDTSVAIVIPTDLATYLGLNLGERITSTRSTSVVRILRIG